MLIALTSYMQEVLVGKPYDSKADMYSLGALLFTLCCFRSVLSLPYPLLSFVAVPAVMARPKTSTD